MLFDLARQVNWLDLLAIIIFIRLFYISTETGLLIETCKVLGTLSGLFLAFENFAPVSSFILERLAIPAGMVWSASFLLLALFGYSIFIVIRDLLLKFIKRPEKPRSWDRIMACLLGFLRAGLVFSMLIVALRLTAIDRLRQATGDSLSAPYFMRVSPQVHKFIITKLLFHIYPPPEKNQIIEDVLE